MYGYVIVPRRVQLEKTHIEVKLDQIVAPCSRFSPNISQP